MAEKYYFGQGKVFTRRYGSNGPWRWWGDVDTLNLGTQTEKVEHKESYSSTKSLVRSIPVGKSMTMTANVFQLDTDGLADTIYGEVSTIAGGSVTGEPLPDALVAGDIIKLDYPGVSSLIITDSAGTPATLTKDTHYTEDGRFGEVTLLDVTGFTQPFAAAYTHAGGKQVNFLTQAQPIVEFRYEGVNMAEDNAPVICEIYKMATDPLQELALITNGNTLASSNISCACLLDSTKPATGPLGQIGRLIEVNAIP
jgi:hypothetical protein